MIRVLAYFILLAVLAYGGVLLVQNPGHITVDWFGEVVEAPAALIIGAIALAAVIVWSVARFVFGLPSFVKVASRQRRREKGYQALSRGLIAVGSGDGRSAGKAASQAKRHLKDDPLAIMLRAQAAHMNGEGYVASAAFEELAQREDTRVLGLRGLYAEAVRRGDEEAARHFATEAHRASPLPWSAQAVLEHRASSGDWEQALATVETGLAARHIDKDVGERQRAVLETAIAYDKELGDPEKALALARSAIKRAPDLAPPVVLAARLLSRKGDIRKASKLIERAWPRCQHPDIAQAYLDVRPGDSTHDRLTRAQTLMGIATFDPVSRTTVARAALANKDFDAARDAMAPLVAEGKRPTVRQCLLMAELEEAEHGDDGLWREWVARASRAPLDPAWICDGTVYDHWAPASPKTGQIDAFRWQVPAERLGPAIDAVPPPRRRTEESLPRRPQTALEHHDAELHEVEPHDSQTHDTPPQAAPERAANAASASHLAEVVAIAPVAEPVTAAAVSVPAVETQSAPSAPPTATPASSASEEILPPVVDAPRQVKAGWPSAAGRPRSAPKAAAASDEPPIVAPKQAAAPEPPMSAATSPRAEIATAVPDSSRGGDAPQSISRQPAADPDVRAETGAATTPAAVSKSLVNPRIGLPPETIAEGRNPSAPRSLFHRRTQPEPRLETSNGVATTGDDLSIGADPARSTLRSVSSGSASDRSAPQTDGATALALPNPRIALPPEVLAEGRSPASPRTLFHRRLTPEAEARAEQIARGRGANGASRNARSDMSRQPLSRPNGSDRAASPVKPS